MDGYIYIMSNKAMPGIVKIGTTKNIEDRMSSLFNSSVPYAFTLHLKRHVMEAYLAEDLIFDALENFRCNSSREFFEITLEYATSIVLSITEQINNQFVDEELDRYYNVWTCPD